MTTGDGNTVTADSDIYGGVAGAPLPPFISSDALVAGGVPIELLMQVLGLAANAGDPADNGLAQEGHEERQLKATDAATKFPENEAKSSQEMAGVSEFGQQIPQIISGLAGGLTGAIGGALKPLTEVPQQLAQQAQSFLQTGMGAMEKAGGDLPDDLTEADLAGDFEPGGTEMGAGGGGGSGGGVGGGGGGGIGTTPMSMLGPPAPPNGSTVPTSSRAMPPVAPAAAATPSTTGGGMGGYPMVPPGAMHGAQGSEGKDDKAATKRVSVPSVKNGAPVQGRVSVPPTGPTVSKQVEGKTISTRRIMIPNDKTDKKADRADDDQGR